MFVGDGKMNLKKAEKEATYPPSLPPPRWPETPEERRWPSPTPMPIVPAEDIGKVLKQILDRLNAIEKRLERIEKHLVGKQPTP